MRLSLSILAICAISLVASAPQQGGSLDDLIAGTFDKPNNQQPAAAAPNTAGNDQNLNVLIDSVFGKPGDNSNNPSTIDINNTAQPPVVNPPGTILGIGNQQNGNENCECVPYYQCSNGTINTDGVGIIDIR